MKRQIIILIGIFVALSQLSCKRIHWDPNGKSGAKGVENLASYKPFGSDVPPYCGNKIDTSAPKRIVNAMKKWTDSLTLTTQGNDKENIRKDIYHSIANLPASVVELLDWMKVDVVIHDAPPPMCKSSVTKKMSEDQAVIDALGKKLTFSEANHYACVDAKGGTSRPTIHIGGNPKLVDEKEQLTQQRSFVKRLIVRNIGMVMGRYFPKHLKAVAQSFVNKDAMMTKASAAVQRLPEPKREAALNVARSVADGLEAMMNFEGAFARHKLNLKNRLFKTEEGHDGLGKSAASQRIEKLIAAKVIPEGDFADVAYMEIFDSWFCIMHGRHTFEQTFTNTAKMFASNDIPFWELVTNQIPKAETPALRNFPRRRR